jgi:serine/threonine protein kinase
MTEGATFGPYRLIRCLAEGGMGQVWEALPAGGTQPVALKTLLPGSTGQPSQLRRFVDEARIGATLEHRNIVQLLDVGIEGGRPYLVMGLLRGRTFAELRSATGCPLPLGLVVGLGLQALRGLDAAHRTRGLNGSAAPVIHRDIKPSNLFLTDEGTVKIIDFGIALAAPSERTSTRTGAIRGSLPYASPEQVRNEPLDPRSDLFSLGLVLHELFTGRRVLDQDNDAAIIGALLWSPIPPLRSRREDVAPPLDECIGWALKNDRKERPTSALEFLEALTASVPAGTPWAEPDIAAWLERECPAPRNAPVRTSTQSQAPHGLTAGTVTERPLRSPRRGTRREMIAALSAAALGAFLWVGGFLQPPNRAAPAELEVPPAEPALEVTAGERPKALALTPTAPQRPPSAAVQRTARNHASRSGWLTVDVRPTYGRVLLDGKEIGVTPLYRFPVQTGTHLVQVVRADGFRRQQRFILSEGEDRKVVFQW